MNREIAERLLESLRPTRHLLTRILADIPIGGPEYRQVNRVVQEIDGLAEILTGDTMYHYRDTHPSRRIRPEHDNGEPIGRPTTPQGRIAALNAIRTGPVSAVERPISVLPDRLPGGRVVRARDISTDEDVRFRRAGRNQRDP